MTDIFIIYLDHNKSGVYGLMEVFHDLEIAKEQARELSKKYNNYEQRIVLSHWSPQYDGTFEKVMDIDYNG